MPTGGYVIYGVAHLHAGGIGAALYREVILNFNVYSIACFLFSSFSFVLSI